MDIQQVKKGSALTAVTEMNTDQYALLTDKNGALTKISKDNLATAVFGSVPKNLMYDNILIMYYDKSSNYPRQVHLDQWTSLQNNGEIACGVVVTEGDKSIVVAPTQAEETLYWASANISGGGVTTSDRRVAFKDWEGEANTKAQIQHAECADVAYAPGFCAAYQRVNANGKGLTAGKWWLPSSGELNMIWNHINGINYAISLITGGVKIPFEAHWSSTEASTTGAWYQNFVSSYGNLYYYNKATYKYRVRPVSAYQ
jgi:hypothetical protein